MLSVLTLGFIFIEEIEPCQFEIQNFTVAHGRFQFAARVMFYPRSVPDFSS